MKTLSVHFNNKMYALIFLSILLLLISCKKDNELIQSSIENSQTIAQKKSYQQPTLNKALTLPRSYFIVGSLGSTSTDVFHVVGNFPNNKVEGVFGYVHSPTDYSLIDINGFFGTLYDDTAFSISIFGGTSLLTTGTDISINNHYNGIQSGVKSGDAATTWLQLIQTDSINYDVMKPVAGVTRMLVGGAPYYTIISPKDSTHLKSGWNEIADLNLGAFADGGKVTFKNIPLLITGLNTELIDTPRLVTSKGDTIPEVITIDKQGSGSSWSAAIGLAPNITIAASYIKKYKLLLNLKITGMAQIVTSANQDKKKFTWKDVLGNKVFSKQNDLYFYNYPYQQATIQNFPF